MWPNSSRSRVLEPIVELLQTSIGEATRPAEIAVRLRAVTNIGAPIGRHPLCDERSICTLPPKRRRRALLDGRPHREQSTFSRPAATAG